MPMSSFKLKSPERREDSPQGMALGNANPSYMGTT